ncbi:hypothetical protein F2Q69_00005483 [Brassica cretica]|uniref:Uncharacterized protein n=1 Tax=Brassica cretica TaxID=69181 RepID=A0A8S9P4B5_BRACR|nr:hypothetical protein F2Q69_00005483 [Brassica cretica]
MRIQKGTQRRTLFRPDRSLHNEWSVGLSSVAARARLLPTELGRSSVAKSRPSCVRARSLRSDRAWLELGRYVATEACDCSAARSLRSDRAV